MSDEAEQDFADNAEPLPPMAEAFLELDKCDPAELRYLANMAEAEEGEAEEPEQGTTDRIIARLLRATADAIEAEGT